MLAVIEIPSGSIYKYEIQPNLYTLQVDRVLTIPVPYNYGYIQNTLSGDGDPTDAFVVTSKPLEALCQVKFEPYFLIEMEDGGLEDNKFVGCIQGDSKPTMDHVRDIIDYLSNYKKGVKIGTITYLGGEYDPSKTY